MIRYSPTSLLLTGSRSSSTSGSYGHLSAGNQPEFLKIREKSDLWGRWMPNIEHENCETLSKHVKLIVWRDNFLDYAALVMINVVYMIHVTNAS